MSKKYPDELKLKCLGLISEDIPLRDITEQLDVPYPTLLKWRTELKEAIENKNITSLVDVDETVVHEVADRVLKA